MNILLRSSGAEGPARAARSIWSPLRQPTFARIWVAATVSNFGGMIQTVGAAWLMTTIATSADQVALVQAAQSLPMLAFALVFGAVADIYDRRLVMLSAQVLMLIVSVALSAMTYLGMITPALLLAFTFLIGCGNALNAPSWQASVSDQVSREELPRAVALNVLGFNLARSLGPGAGGVVVAIAGAPLAFLLNAFSYVGLIGVLIGWKRPKVERALPPERIGSAVLAGLQYVRLSPPVSAIMLRTFCFALCGSAIWALMPLLAREVLHGGPAVYGLLFGALGLGAVFGAGGSAWLRERLAPEIIVRCAGLTFGAAMAVAALSAWVPVTAVAMFAGGVGWILSMSSFNISVQTFSPGWVVGRSMSLFQTCMAGGLTIGSWAWGHVAEGASIPAAIGLSAAATAATVLLGLRWRVPPLDQRPDFEPTRQGAPRPPVLLEPPHGVVTVSVEYRVRESDAPAFVAAMAEKRRIRSRDGARRWTLMQDLVDSEVWLERFHSPNWTEHLRQRHRITKADHQIEQRVRDFHCAEEPPRVRRFIDRAAVPARGAIPAAQADLP